MLYSHRGGEKFRLFLCSSSRNQLFLLKLMGPRRIALLIKMRKKTLLRCYEFSIINNKHVCCWEISLHLMGAPCLENLSHRVDEERKIRVEKKISWHRTIFMFVVRVEESEKKALSRSFLMIQTQFLSTLKVIRQAPYKIVMAFTMGRRKNGLIHHIERFFLSSP